MGGMSKLTGRQKVEKSGGDPASELSSCGWGGVGMKRYPLMLKRRAATGISGGKRDKPVGGCGEGGGGAPANGQRGQMSSH